MLRDGSSVEPLRNTMKINGRQEYIYIHIYNCIQGRQVRVEVYIVDNAVTHFPNLRRSEQ